MERPHRYGPFLSLRKVVILFLFTIWVCQGSAEAEPRLVHVIVALADNAHQGIVPVPEVLGNGDDPGKNLDWGAAFGVRTFLRKSSAWKEIATVEHPNSAVLERSVFLHTASGTYLISDAYRGREIKTAINDFFRLASGQDLGIGEIELHGDEKNLTLPARTDLVVYGGHDGLMDFSLEKTLQGTSAQKREVIVLACASKGYFSTGLRPTGAQPLLWTTGLMAPEAYTLKAALDGWIAGESAEQVRERAAMAYAKYQKISASAAERLFSSSW